MITLKEKRRVNKKFRASDDSHLYPICGRFNATERAIRHARKIANANGEFGSAYEYSECLSWLLSQIVNDPKNH